MAGKRLALLIGNSTYTDQGFPSLNKPAQDVRSLADVLRDPKIGYFDEVQTVIDPFSHEVNVQIERFFRKKKQDDLLLLYFSGHGKKEGGELYFAVKNTAGDALDSTAIAAAFVIKQLEKSFAERKVIILDCCYSGVFLKGLKGGALSSEDVKEVFEGQGRVVLTSSSPVEESYEDPTLLENLKVLGDIKNSLFTHFFVEGLRTGAADEDQDGNIFVNDIFKYVQTKIRAVTTKQTPCISLKATGEILLAKNPVQRNPRDLLPGWIKQLLDADDRTAKLTGVSHLVTISKSGAERVAEAVRLELQRLSQAERDPVVRGAAKGALDDMFPARGEASETPALPGQEFTFEVITVDPRGKEMKCARKTARQQIEDLGQGVKLEMVLIPGGTFLMGQTDAEQHYLLKIVGKEKYEQWYRCELPRYEVRVQEFWMGKYPVTQAQWEAVMGNNPANFKGTNRPVEMVSWNDVQEFLRKLNTTHPYPSQEGKNKTNPLLGGVRGGFRLPSEAEWEYACRAGTTTPFHFGETLTPDFANYNGNYTYASGPKGKYREQTTDVGSFPPNAFGLHDMHGNVWEWCADPWHENYNGASTDGSVWETGGNASFRLLRGGAWNFSPLNCRCAYRNRNHPADRHGLIGFRVVCSSVRTL